MFPLAPLPTYAGKPPRNPGRGPSKTGRSVYLRLAMPRQSPGAVLRAEGARGHAAPWAHCGMAVGRLDDIRDGVSGLDRHRKHPAEYTTDVIIEREIERLRCAIDFNERL
jgi:hypothetical protein